MIATVAALTEFLTSALPCVNAVLNALAACLLLAGLRFIRRGNIAAHRRTMYAAFATSCLFLTSYLVHKAIVQRTHPYEGPPSLATLYYVVLWSHVVLAAAVPFLALRTIYLGLKDRRDQHRRLARLTFPIWLYVSATGVIIFLMLYVLPAADR